MCELWLVNRNKTARINIIYSNDVTLGGDLAKTGERSGIVPQNRKLYTICRCTLIVRLGEMACFKVDRF